MATVRSATLTDVDQLVNTFTRAFDRDPIINCLIREDHLRWNGLKIFFRQCLTELSLPYGMTLTSSDCMGGAMWIPSEHIHLSFLSQLRLLPDMVRAAGWKKLPRLVDFMDRIDRQHPRDPHFYLMFMGVDPAFQKRRIGSGLTSPVLIRCDRECRAAYLENSNPINQRFYERLGFRVTGKIQVYKGGPSIDCMWREPQVSSAEAQ